MQKVVRRLRNIREGHASDRVNVARKVATGVQSSELGHSGIQGVITSQVHDFFDSHGILVPGSYQASTTKYHHSQSNLQALEPWRNSKDRMFCEQEKDEEGETS
ncbi:hypothetical protein BTVI_04103 [Pitangus sulphuratus]|nr:hypothetical protein BTVI_04103 [Pitangus sulphuratus]